MKRIGIVGGGHMGEAFIKALDKQYDVVVCEKRAKRQAHLRKTYRVQTQDIKDFIHSCDVFLVAVKPQDIDSFLKEIKALEARKVLVLSIAAGLSISFLEKAAGKNAHVIRAMPNLPIMVQQGVTALCQGSQVTAKEVRFAIEIFSQVGKVILVHEQLMDAITAVSGSGPGYVYFFAEQMIEAGKALGLSDQLSKDLVIQTFLGSVKLMSQQKESPAILRSKVTSKAGTTQAALDVFLENKMDLVFRKALKAAKKRSQDLSRRST